MRVILYTGINIYIDKQYCQCTSKFPRIVEGNCHAIVYFLHASDY